jgi:protein-tyrosine-phosphatase
MYYLKMKALEATSAVLLLLFILATPAIAAEETIHVLFVCKGNIMRSVIAELLFEKLVADKNLAGKYSASSRGMQGTPGWPVLPTHGNLKYYNEANGSNAWEQSQPSLKTLGIEEELKAHKAAVVTAKDLEKADLVVALNRDVLSDSSWGLKTQFPDYRDKMILFTEIVGSDEGIADPIESKENGNKYQRVVLQIDDVLKRGFDTLCNAVRLPDVSPRSRS